MLNRFTTHTHTKEKHIQTYSQLVEINLIINKDC